MSYSIKQIAEIIGGEQLQAGQNNEVITHLLFDSRKTHFTSQSLFFALKGNRKNGHNYISELYEKGIRNYVISDRIDISLFPEANFILVENSVAALQQLASFHRNQFEIPIIGITGSNGKTIVKEWLYQLLHDDYQVVRNPKSYNSQIGVPLSVWQMNASHTLGIFEAGISQVGEMEKLEPIIQPTIGVLTNIGEAHNEGFAGKEQKFEEKIKFFENCDVIVAREKDIEEYNRRKDFFLGQKVLTWGESSSNSIAINSITKTKTGTEIKLTYQSSPVRFEIPFTDDASIENAITCSCVMLYLGYKEDAIAERIKNLQSVNMRLELKKGINHCLIINDSYVTDLSSLNVALNFLQDQNPGMKKTVIISDFLQTGLDDQSLYSQVAALLLQHKVNRVIGIGEKIHVYLRDLFNPFSVEQDYFLSTEEFINHFRFSSLREETILVKGARVFQFEKIVRLLEQKFHHTVLEINLNAIAQNLKAFQSVLKPSTRIMAMVKAFAYGSGGAEIAGALQYHQADYLGVAYADEGVELRRSGIKLPIMVMNPEEDSFEAIVEYDLEPEIYSFELLKAFDLFIKKESVKNYPIHIEIETGMNRLGFSMEDVENLADYLLSTDSFKVQSVFTHLAASEEPQQDVFTLSQAKIFTKSYKQLEKKLGYKFLKHISNTAAVLRHPQQQMDMVRLGIGLYGVDSSGDGKIDLQTVATLKATISQVKKIKKGESVSYGRKGIAAEDAVIATVRIGYADGFPRRLSNGKGFMYVNGRLAPVIGTVCMDMTMIDVSDVPGVKEGDEVIVFGKELPVEKLAQWAETIPYEIMTGISQRVRRVYYEE